MGNSDWSFRRVLHGLRLADAWVFWPALAMVLWGELSPAPLLPEENDKLLHFIAYFGLSWLGLAACRSRRNAFFAGLFLAIVGGLVEVAQGYIGRDMSLYDELTNIEIGRAHV